MKALESAPERYDKGIRWLGWSKLDSIRDHIADIIEAEGETVLEIGAGTGTQALLLAKRGLEVTGIDHSSGMLAIAQGKIDSHENEEGGAEIAARVTLLHKAAVELDEFTHGSFDAVTSTLVFSELHPSEQRYVLSHAFQILKPGGVIVLADEVVPHKLTRRLAHTMISAPLKLITYLVTQTSTKAVQDLDGMIEETGFEIESIENHQLDSFQLIIARKPKESDAEGTTTSSIKFKPIEPPSRSVLSTLWETAARMIGHSTEIGLIPVGEPTPDSPVLCTCNFELTVRRLYKLLKTSKINSWILVAPTDGINVWCASCGDNFNAGSVIMAIKVSSLERYVNHRRIILPQLGASGIDSKKVSQITGWHCIWGPVHMNDIPSFLADFPKSIRNKTERQKAVRFGAVDRLEMASAIFFPILLLLMLPLSLVLFLLNQRIWIIPIVFTMLIQIYGLFLLWPIIPSGLGTCKTGIWSVVIIVLISLASWYTTGVLQLPFPELPYFQDFFAFLNWWPILAVILILLIILIYDADGMTPTLRSSLAARSWNKGKTEVQERWGSSYSLLPYGEISVILDSCNGCGVCVDVCPMLIPFMDKESRKVLLRIPERCVNCRACINRCPEKALFLKPETEAARQALLELQKE
jgi:demethylmenaquinone methyltransferase/2-methoxy-6-polyprenyl-1,4-benzoquinol methylase